MEWSQEELVISGMAGRFPESPDLDHFTSNLYQGMDMITEIKRWTPGLYGLPTRFGTLSSLDKFDAEFFGIHPKQGNVLDPQIRQLLELTHAAILDAGVNPSQLRGSKTGVYVGAYRSESDEGWCSDPDKISGYEATGCMSCMFANRISFAFDLRGPSMTIDTACSSSLVALTEAMIGIRTGRCEAAIVAGANITPNPKSYLLLQLLGVMAPDGKCKTFDISANGYVRSEAVAVIYIQKRSAPALRHYATLLHGKTSADGYKAQGITYPNGEEQQKLLAEIYEEAGLSPDQLTYVEAHGTGTNAGDREELNSVTRAFCKNRTDKNPLLVGSVKSNMGHSENASGLCGLAKILIAMKNEKLPANLHFTSPNPEIPALVDGRLKVVAENTKWDGSGIVGINSFGFGGTNAHCVLRSNPKKIPANLLSPSLSSLPLIIPLSGRTRECVEFALEKIIDSTRDDERVALLHRISRHAVTGHSFRGFTLIGEGQGVNSSLLEVQELASQEGRRPIWLIFSGMGSQYKGMGRSLTGLDIFANSIQHSANVLKREDDTFDLTSILFDDESSTFDHVTNSFVGIVAIQIALLDLLDQLGVRPDGMIGHSLGELVCALADGSFSKEQTIQAAFLRGQSLVESNCPKGSMASLGLSWEEAIAQCPSGIFPACHNAKDNVSVSGPADQIEEFIASLKAQGIFARQINSSGQAFHTQYISGAGVILKKKLEKIISKNPPPRTTRWISSSIPEAEWYASEWAQVSGPNYHVNNLVSPVLFQEALTHVPPNAVVIEVAPHALFQSILKRSLAPSVFNLGLMHRDHGGDDGVRHFLTSIGKLYNCGLHPSFENLYQKMEFPVSLKASFISPLVRWDHRASWDLVKFPLMKIIQFLKTVAAQAPNNTYFIANISIEISTAMKEESDEGRQDHVVEISLEDPAYQFYADHVIDGRTIFPATGYIHIVWQTFAKQRRTSVDRQAVVFENIKFLQATILPPSGSVKFSINIFETTGDFQVTEGKALVVTGRVRVLNEEDRKEVRTTLNLKNGRENVDQWSPWRLPIKANDFYQELYIRGYGMSGLFSGGLKLASHDGQWALLEWQENWPVFIDSLLQLVSLTMPDRGLTVPTSIGRVILDPETFFNELEKNEIQVNGITAFHHLNRTTVECPGIQIRSWKSSVLLRRQLQKVEPKLDEYSFTPYFPLTRQNIKVSPARAFRSILDLVVENLVVAKVKIVEFLKKDANSVLEFVEHTFANQALIDYDLNIVVMTSMENSLETEGQQPVWMEEADKLPEVHVLYDDSVDGDDGKNIPLDLAPESCHLIIVDELQFLINPELLSKLKIGGFVLYKATEELTEMDASELKLIDLQIMAHVPQPVDSHAHLFLLRKMLPQTTKLRAENVMKIIPIEIEEHRNYEWVEEIRTAMKLAAAAPSSQPGVDDQLRIYLVSSRWAESGIVGLVRCLRHEEGGHALRCIYNKETHMPLELDFSCPDDNLKMILELDLVMNVFEFGAWGSYRHYPLTDGINDDGAASSFLPEKNFETHAYLTILVPGDLSTLRWVQGPLNESDLCGEKKEPSKNPNQEGEVCTVHCASLNFRDLMLATGTLPMGASGQNLRNRDSFLGMEFSGKNLKNNERVMGVYNSSMATHVQTNSPGFLLPVPPKWSLQQAATVPLAYATAYYALIVRGRLRSGESVLIHSGSGSVGHAAIQIAFSLNCIVLTTVSTPQRREHLKQFFPQLNDQNFANSRDTTFEHHVMDQTNGRGVDLVLNSLDDDRMRASLRCLAPGGRFLEIGHQQSKEWNLAEMSVGQKNVSFHGIILEQIFEKNCPDQRETIQLFQEGIQNGVVIPLPLTTFECDQVEDAFRFMAGGEYVGKIVVMIRPDRVMETEKEEKAEVLENSVLKHPSPSTIIMNPRRRCYFSPNEIQIIIGGLGGLGLQLAAFLVERGAKKLALVSRSGVTTGYQQYCLHRFRDQMVQIVTPKSVTFWTTEVAQDLLTNVVKSLDNCPVGGIWSLAMVLNIGLIESQTPRKFEEVCQPKLHSTFCLDQASRKLAPKLKHFVTFSSVASGRGFSGQSGYGFGNSAMEQICIARRKEGLPGLAIQWGPVAEVGVYHDNYGGSEETVAGVIPQKLVSCLNVLDKFLQKSQPVVSSVVIADKRGDVPGTNGTDVDSGVMPKMADSIAYILGMKDASGVNTNLTLTELGMDSLMSFEVNNLLQRKWDLQLSKEDVRHLTIEILNQMESQRQEEKQFISADSANIQKDVKTLSISESQVLKTKQRQQMDTSQSLQVTPSYPNLMPNQLGPPTGVNLNLNATERSPSERQQGGQTKLKSLEFNKNQKSDDGRREMKELERERNRNGQYSKI